MIISPISLISIKLLHVSVIKQFSELIDLVSDDLCAVPACIFLCQSDYLWEDFYVGVNLVYVRN